MSGYIHRALERRCIYLPGVKMLTKGIWDVKHVKHRVLLVAKTLCDLLAEIRILMYLVNTAHKGQTFRNLWLEYPFQCNSLQYYSYVVHRTTSIRKLLFYCSYRSLHVTKCLNVFVKKVRKSLFSCYKSLKVRTVDKSEHCGHFISDYILTLCYFLKAVLIQAWIPDPKTLIIFIFYKHYLSSVSH